MTTTTMMMNRLLSVQRWEVITASNTKTSSRNNSNNDRPPSRSDLDRNVRKAVPAKVMKSPAVAVRRDDPQGLIKQNAPLL
eukprot:scaffold5676_cov189-Alexandrium_tamarense.AAC.2